MTVERAPAIEQLVRDARAAWKAGDLQALEPMLSHEGSLLFTGSDPGEVWHGRDQVLRAAHAAHTQSAWTAMPERSRW
jgi:SnoaL-like domain